MQHNFVGRDCELRALAAGYASKEAQLVLLSGRRRIGKTYLLQRFSERKRVVFYQATRQAAAHELAAFTAVARQLVGGLPPGYAFPTWESALDFLSERAPRNRLAVILDEFPYLCESTPGLPSIIQRWWDRGGNTSRLMLILCGSAQTFMADLESSSAPLHQRFTIRLMLAPLSYREAGEFVKALAPSERAIVFGILGGTPLYLRQWDVRCGIAENLERLFGDPASLLVESARLVLHVDLGDAAASYRALGAIAGGATRRNDVLQKASISNERTLTRLEQLHLVRRRIPVTEGAESRRGVYVVEDPYFRFWFRFIEPHMSAIDRGFGSRLVSDVIMPGLSAHMGSVFEDMARAFAGDLVRDGSLRALDIGSWWSTDGRHEIDIVGVRGRMPTFIGTVKWRETPLDWGVYTNLEGHARALDAGHDIPWLMIGRGGVATNVLDRAPHVRGFSIAELYE